MNEGDLVAGRYRLLRPIGRGAMGTVWAGRHELLGRDFALKFATLPVRAGPEARERFLHEAQAIGRLRHPNVVDVADFGEVAPGGGLYLAMELLEGQSLAARIEEQGALRPSEAAAIAAEIARGLSAAHAAGIVHRDIKPENIFLARGARGGLVPKLLDFGISKQRSDEASPSTNGAPIGTPAYMSPEQALGELDVDHRTDVWSLGVVLHEMLAGKHPFVAPNYQALMTKIAESPPAPLDASVPEVVRVIVSRCLQKNPSERYTDADALAAALEDALARIGPPADVSIERSRALPSLRPPGSPGAADAPPSRRGPALAAALLVAIGLLAGLAVIGLRSGREADPAPPPPAPSAITTTEGIPTPPRTPPAEAPPSASPPPTSTQAPLTPRTANAVTRPPAGSASGKPSVPLGKRPTTNVNDPGF
ncbi:protein kinase domain-containing protein [Polyangium spumosum]|uniref:Protein kinase n=1 Tax=Polyangium spumosum TaxID=889282 RepID=A0A6N7PHE4_9BACT|nr:protein kinase [Polyangium spumosum]